MRQTMIHISLVVTMCVSLALNICQLRKSDMQQRAICELTAQLDFEIDVVEELQKHFDIKPVLKGMKVPAIHFEEWTDDDLRELYGPCNQ